MSDINVYLGRGEGCENVGTFLAGNPIDCPLLYNDLKMTKKIKNKARSVACINFSSRLNCVHFTGKSVHFILSIQVFVTPKCCPFLFDPWRHTHEDVKSIMNMDN